MFKDYEGNEYETLEEVIEANNKLVEKTEDEKTEDEKIEVIKKPTKKELLKEIDDYEQYRDSVYSEYVALKKKAENDRKNQIKEVCETKNKQIEELKRQIDEITKEAHKEIDNINKQTNDYIKEQYKTYKNVNDEYLLKIKDYCDTYGNGTYSKIYDNNKLRKEFMFSNNLGSVFNDIFNDAIDWYNNFL